MDAFKDANINLADSESMASFGRVIDIDALREEVALAWHRAQEVPENSWHKDGYMQALNDMVSYLLKMAPLDDYPEQRI